MEAMLLRMLRHRLSCVLLLLLSYLVVVNSSTYPSAAAVEAAPAATACDAAVVVVVSLDGTGRYKSIGAAIAAAPLRSPVRHVIHVKRGVYKEYIKITKDMWNIELVGEGMDATIITGDHAAASRYDTMKSATVDVRGPGFIARFLRIENTAGAGAGQAVALMSESDHSVHYRCSLQGYQDTLYARLGNQFYRECDISGTVDFIFGDAAAVFHNCNILARLPQRGQANTITAQGRDAANSTGGFVFQFCAVAADKDLLGANFTVNTYLGRPWRKYSRVVFIKSAMSAAVHPDGWLPWNATMPVDSLYFAEYKNSGPGARIGGRVRWPGVHSIIGDAQASKFTVQNFIGGNTWLPPTGVPFTPGL